MSNKIKVAILSGGDSEERVVSEKCLRRPKVFAGR